MQRRMKHRANDRLHRSTPVERKQENLGRKLAAERAMAAPNRSPVVELNRAVAVAMRDGLEASLALIDALLARGELVDYHRAHATRAVPCRRLRTGVEARAAHERALGLTRQEPEGHFIAGRLRELDRH